MASLSLQRVSKSFPGRPRAVEAVCDLSLDVADGEFMALVGPSGCGKTTTLRLIAGLERCDRGSIKIGGGVVHDVPPHQRDVAMVFQDLALYPHMTVWENIGFGLKMRRMPKASRVKRVGEVATALGIEDLLQRRPASLSGGQRQRVALGRAMVRYPNVFLLDEPLSSLEATLRVQLQSELRLVQRELGATMIYVTHDQEEAMRLADRMAVMYEGTIRQTGSPLEVYRCPADRIVARLIGSPPINLLHVELDGQAGETELRGAFGRIALDGETAGAARNAGHREWIVGLRPEHVRPACSEIGRKGPWRRIGTLKVRSVETLGDCTHVRFMYGAGEVLIGRCECELAPGPGERVDVEVDLRGLHLFSADERGRRLS